MLRRVEGAVAIAEPEHLVQARREALDARLGNAFGDAVQDEDLAAPRANRHAVVRAVVLAVVRERAKAARFDRELARQRHFDDAVELGFGATAAPRRAELLRGQRGGR